MKHCKFSIPYISGAFLDSVVADIVSNLSRSEIE